jgi:hypothetical protein
LQKKQEMGCGCFHPKKSSLTSPSSLAQQPQQDPTMLAQQQQPQQYEEMAKEKAIVTSTWNDLWVTSEAFKRPNSEFMMLIVMFDKLDMFRSQIEKLLCFWNLYSIGSREDNDEFLMKHEHMFEQCKRDFISRVKMSKSHVFVSIYMSANAHILHNRSIYDHILKVFLRILEKKDFWEMIQDAVVYKLDEQSVAVAVAMVFLMHPDLQPKTPGDMCTMFEKTLSVLLLQERFWKQPWRSDDLFKQDNGNKNNNNNNNSSSKSHKDDKNQENGYIRKRKRTLSFLIALPLVNAWFDSIKIQNHQELLVQKQFQVVQIACAFAVECDIDQLSCEKASVTFLQNTIEVYKTIKEMYMDPMSRTEENGPVLNVLKTHLVELDQHLEFMLQIVMHEYLNVMKVYNETYICADEQLKGIRQYVDVLTKTGRKKDKRLAQYILAEYNLISLQIHQMENSHLDESTLQKEQQQQQQQQEKGATFCQLENETMPNHSDENSKSERRSLMIRIMKSQQQRQEIIQQYVHEKEIYEYGKEQQEEKEKVSAAVNISIS